MIRQYLCTLACIAAGALSCGSLAGFGPNTLAASQIETTASDTGTAPVDPNIAITIDYLERRESGLSQSEIPEVAAAIVGESRRYGLDPNLVLAVIHIESRGNVFALSPAGAMGIMQIMPATGEELAWELEIPWTGSQTLFEPIMNIRMGVAYLKQLEDRFGDLSIALAAYNWGPGAIDRRIRRGATLPARYPGMVLTAYDDHEAEHRNTPVSLTSRY
jgi:soluble lytic murein transglycosylase-like protein